MIDFSICDINKFKYYGGKNGNKVCIIYNGDNYMLKFPSSNSGLSEHVYSNNCISEYISCNIIKSIGLNVQETLLGTYSLNGNKKIVVACKDFTSENTVLKQFAELKNSQIETSNNGYGTELSEVLEAIEGQIICDTNDVKRFFWDMFIADSFIGNFDRHNGNWGFLINEVNEEIKLAPIYDCASCLFPQLTDERITEILEDDKELLARVFVFPNSALKVNNEKINYFKFINSFEYTDCNEALLRIYPKINMNVIYSIIDNTPFISNIRKTFYKKILALRYEEILTFAYKNLT